MGSCVAESSGVSTVTHTEENFVENDCRENRKKKRRPRKSKQTLSACTSASELCIDASGSPGVDTTSYCTLPNGHHQSRNENSDEGISLVSSIHGNEHTTNGNLEILRSFPHESKDSLSSSLVPEPVVGDEPLELVMVPQSVDSLPRRFLFPPYWSAHAISKGLEKGELWRAVFRVNSYNRLEAYCKIEGVQTDILINGVVAQNRAVDGDIVAIAIDPPSIWPRMKGSNESPDNPASHGNSRDVIHDRGCSMGKCKLHAAEAENGFSRNNMVIEKGGAYHDNVFPVVTSDVSDGNAVLADGYVCGCQMTISDTAYDSRTTLEKFCALISSLPSKRPTGMVVAVIERSVKRESIVGFLSVKQWVYSRESKKKNSRRNKSDHGYVLLTPTDPKFTKMMVPLRNLPMSIRKRLDAGDLTIESELVAAKVVDWAQESHFPTASVVHVFGRGSDVEAQIAAILYENAIDASDFSSEVLSSLPHMPWEIPPEESRSRIDLRNLCIFTIDPSTATDLDDALSVETLPNGNFRVGVHIADVSYFVLPDTAIDFDAQIRSNSVYLLLQKLPMLPPMLSDNVASLNPGVDRLAFSIFWDINSKGEVLDRWIGRTIIRSCCKLSYEHAQDIIDGLFEIQDSSQMVKNWPKLHGQFEWFDVIKSVNQLNEISKLLRKTRFEGGALSLESPKIVFLFDEEGIPYDIEVSGRKPSNFLVEEFMLLANRTAAEVITRTYPSSALLRRHPEPNARKLREFEAFSNKHGLKLDISSSTHLHSSLERIRGELKNDSVLLDILMSYAARPMQLATYFCSGESKDGSDLGHYALAVPLYTHFTSPLRRYPDILVHRTLAAALEAEDIYLSRNKMSSNITRVVALSRCFTGMRFDKDEIESIAAQEALFAAASKHKVLGTDHLADLAAYCNERKLATRHVKDATDKLYMWVLLKRKEILYSDARVLGLGPRFMSIYVTKLAMERRIYYEEVEGLTAEWLENTSTLVLSQSTNKRSSKKGSPGKWRTIDDTALIIAPPDPKIESSGDFVDEDGEISDRPAFFPLTVRVLSTIPVALHAIGGDDGPLDIVARLYISSYFD